MTLRERYRYWRREIGCEPVTAGFLALLGCLYGER